MTAWHNRSGGGGPALLVAEVQKATGAWVDVAGDVLHATGGMTIQMAGRQTELSAGENAILQFTVNNDAGAYTPGYASAPVSLALGMPVRVRETVGRRSFRHYQGTLNQPEASFGGLPNKAGDVVSATAVDWLGGQEQGRTFISTLAEHILYHGGDELVAYWPMGESGTAAQFEAQGPTARPALVPEPIISNVAVSGGTFEFGTTDPLPADDLRRMTCQPTMDTSGSPAIATSGKQPRVEFLETPITVDAGEYLTLACWLRPTGQFDATYKVVLSGSGLFLELKRALNADSRPGAWKAHMYDGGVTWQITAYVQSVSFDDDMFVAVTVTPSPAMTMYAGTRTAAGAVTGTPTSSWTFNTIAFENFTGSGNHLQIYKGDANAWTYAKQVAQWQQGRDGMIGGLRWQRTDERILTLARYAGLSASQCALDRGVAYMPRALLAGKTFTTAAGEAVATEQGRLLVAGDGRLAMHSRLHTRYNL